MAAAGFCRPAGTQGHNQQQLGTALGRLLGGRNQLRYGTARMALWQAGSPHAWWCGGSIGIRVGRSEGVVRAPRGRPRRRGGHNLIPGSARAHTYLGQPAARADSLKEFIL
jgi:hypothetical protein